MFAAIDQLAAGDFDGPEQVLSSGEQVRSWPVRPFRISYQRDDEVFAILRIHHQARHPLAT